MKFRVWGVASPSTPVGALVMLFMTFPGLFLPLDVLYAFPGVMTYAAPDQAARIFLYLVALSVVMSTLCCLGCIAVGVLAGNGCRYDAEKTAYYALWLSLTLAVFALGHGLLVWSSYFIEYSPELRWIRMSVIFALSIPVGIQLVRRLREKHFANILAVLRAGALLVAIATLACAGIAVQNPERDPEQSQVAEANGDRPSIFLISIDTLSAAHLPMYGYRRPTAPRLSEFAEGATVFRRNYANSNFTTSSVNSIMYAVRPWTHRAIQHEGMPLAKFSADSLPAILRGAGYFAASVSTNPWAAPRNLRLAQYFSVLSENNVCAANNPLWVLRAEVQVAIKSSLVANTLLSLFVRATDAIGVCEGTHFDPELAFSEARRVLAETPSGRPLFLWVHLFPPHDPYVTPQGFVGAFASDSGARDRASTTPPYLFEARHRWDFPGLYMQRYDEAVRYVDHHVGAFLDELKRRGQYDKSMIVITADHGESFSNGYGGHGGPGMYEDLIRIPLLIKAPGQTARKEVGQLSEQVDLAPTILELAGIRRNIPGEGISLARAMQGHRLERPVFAMNFQQSPRLGALDTGIVAMVDGRWKYVHFFGDIYYPMMVELKDGLYDLASDPWETQNLIPMQPEVADRMRREIQAKLAQHGKRVQ